jgi:PAS domain S-box-containing protein
MTGISKATEILNEIRDGIFTTDQMGVITFVNEPLAKMHGLDGAEKMIGKHFSEFVSPEFRTEISDKFKKAVEEESYSEVVEFSTVRKDGGVIFIQLRHGPIVEDGQIVGTAGVVRDVTDRKRAERALAASEKKYRTIVENMGDVVFIVDQSGTLLFITPSATRMIGYELSEMIGHNIQEFIHREDVNSALNNIRHAVSEKGIASNEYRIQHKNGSIICMQTFTRPLLEGDDVVAVQGSFWDITERKQAEEALRRARDDLETKVKERTAELQQINERLSAENRERVRTEQSLRLEESRLDALLHLSRIGEAPLEEITEFTLEQAIALSHSKIGFLGFVNKDESLYTLHAVSRNVVKECNVTGHRLQWHVIDAGIWADAIREHKTLIVNDYSKPHPRKRGLPPGHPHVERFMVVPIIESERVVAVAGVGNKASEYDKSDERQIVLLLSGMCGYLQKQRSRQDLQKAYNALHERTTQLEQLTAELTLAEQLERRRIAEILHDDLQQLLVGAKISSEILLAKIEASQKVVAENILGLINQSIKISRSLTAELSPPALRQGLSAALQWLGHWMGEKQGLKVQLRTDPALNPERENITVFLFQSARELLFNVIKHSGVKRARLEMTSDEENRLRVTVSDQGTGFDPATIWETDKAQFGLFAVRRRLELIGGSLQINSSPGNGASLSLIAPLKTMKRQDEKDILKIMGKIQSAKAPGDKIRVLIVDDHTVLRQGLSALLNLHSDIKAVGEAVDGEDAVEKARELHPDVILMDISMPKMDGIKATRIIHSELPRIRIIGLSMHDNQDEADGMIEAGATAYCTKDGATDVLLCAIRGATKQAQ